MARFVKATPANSKEASEDPWVRKIELEAPTAWPPLVFMLFQSASKHAQGHTQKLLKKILKMF